MKRCCLLFKKSKGLILWNKYKQSKFCYLKQSASSFNSSTLLHNCIPLFEIINSHLKIDGYTISDKNIY